MTGFDRGMSLWSNLMFGAVRPLICWLRGHRDHWWDVVADDDHTHVLHQFSCCSCCARIVERPVPESTA